MVSKKHQAKQTILRLSQCPSPYIPTAKNVKETTEKVIKTPGQCPKWTANIS